MGKVNNRRAVERTPAYPGSHEGGLVLILIVGFAAALLFWQTSVRSCRADKNEKAADP